MKTLFYFSLFTFIFSLLSCSPQQRMTRLVRNNPQLVINDTTRFSRLVIFPARTALYNLPDSLFNRMQPGDSIISVSKKGVTIIVRRNNQSTEIEASVPADTVTVDTTIVTPTVTVIEDIKADRKLKMQKLRIIYIVSIIVLLIVITTIIRKVIGH